MHAHTIERGRERGGIFSVNRLSVPISKHRLIGSFLAVTGVTTTSSLLIVTMLRSCLDRFASNIGIVLTNKFLLSPYGFRYPVFLTLCHMVACMLMSSAVEAAGIVQRQPIKTTAQFWKIVALSTAFLVAVALGNVSLRFIPVSFSQVCLLHCRPQVLVAHKMPGRFCFYHNQDWHVNS